jgi:hypothetical protein
VYPNINRWLTNVLRFMPGSSDACASSSYDGTVKVSLRAVGMPLGWCGAL